MSSTNISGGKRTSSSSKTSSLNNRISCYFDPMVDTTDKFHSAVNEGRIDQVKHLLSENIELLHSEDKIFLTLNSYNNDRIDSPIEHYKTLVNVLEDIQKRYFTPHQTHESLAIKLHLIAESIKHAGTFCSSSSNGSGGDGPKKADLKTLVKQFLSAGKAQPSDLIPIGQENFIQRSLVSFPHQESTLWHILVEQVSRSAKPGQLPTALDQVTNAINNTSGMMPTARDTLRCVVCYDCEDDCRDDDLEQSADKSQSAVHVRLCCRCRRVAYCSVDCQRLHWFVHKRHCSNSSS